MTLIHCRECGKKISTKAVYCPHCGASPHRITIETEIRMIIMIILLTITIIVAVKTPKIHNLLFSNWAKKDNVFSFPIASLEVTYSQSYKVLYDRVAVAGQVKNIGDKILPDIEVIVRWFDKSGNLILSDTARINTNPLYPNRVGNFEVISVYNDSMADYQLAFRTLAGGGDIAIINKR